MSEKLTRIRLSGTRYGIQDWGEHTFEDMVAQMRRRGEALRAEADAILNAAPGDFEVAIIRGPWVQHHVRDVLPSPQEQATQ